METVQRKKHLMKRELNRREPNAFMQKSTAEIGKTGWAGESEEWGERKE